jgi:acetyl esterase/lipase
MVDKENGSKPRSGKLRPELLAALAALWTAGTVAIVVGALFPEAPKIGTIGTLLESFFSLHIVIVAVLGLGLALLAQRVRGGLLGKITIAVALLGTIGSAIPLVALMRAAQRYNSSNIASISWADHLRVIGPKLLLPRDPKETAAVANIDGTTLYADIYLPPDPPAGLSAAVLFLHGGGYIHGKRSMPNEWDRWLAERGYTVFDVDYRLAPPPTWNQAAQDTACAMVWIATHAATYRVDPQRLLLAGQSAGAGLALQAAYGLRDGTLASSCGGVAPQPKAIFALYPPDDFALGWNLDTKAGSASARLFLRDYIGGSPADFPDRYRAVSAIYHVRPDLPPMLIVSGDHDHLVPYQGHIEFVEKLNQAGVPNTFVTVPYGEHAFDIAWGSLGAQIARHALAEFLRKYLPLEAAH